LIVDIHNPIVMGYEQNCTALLLANFCISSTTSRPDFLSNAAVGSSASTIFGCVTKALAIATRCFCSPEGFSG
jgi:hypothetical protein